MSNVWTSIAFNAPCAARRARARPLLQLFTGYVKYQKSLRSYRTATLLQSAAEKPHARSRTSNIVKEQYSRDVSTATRHAFSTTAFLSAQGRRKRPPPPPTKDYPGSEAASQLKPAHTVASHTEGLPAEEEDEGITWRDYDPEGGMPLPNGELPQAEINAVFGGENLDVDNGNYVLSVMQWRRMSGALIDSGLDFPKRSGVTRDQALRGLQYVRTLDPTFDEQGAGQRWAEEESLRLQQEIQQRSINLGIYKAEEEEPESQQGTEYGRERSRESVLVTHRQEREAQWEKEQAEEAAAKEREELAALHAQRGPLELAGGVQPSVALTNAGAGGVTIGQPQTKAWLAPVERKPWVKYYEEQAQVIKTNILPQISLLGRLGPSFLVMLAVIGLGLFVSNNYTPPPKSARFFPDTPPAVATIAALTAAMAAVTFFGRLPPLWRTLSKYFTIIPAYPNAISLVGAAFRHDTFSHLLTNSIALWLFGLLLHEDVGRGTFLAIFFSAGAVGGFSSLAYNVLRKQWMSYVFGSSGCVLGVVAAACALHPTGNIKVLGYEVPIAAWVFLALFGGAEAVAAVRGAKTTIDHAGHLGGIAAGVAAGFYLRSGTDKGVEKVKVAGNGEAARREGGEGGEGDLMVEVKAA